MTRTPLNLTRVAALGTAILSSCPGGEFSTGDDSSANAEVPAGTAQLSLFDPTCDAGDGSASSCVACVADHCNSELALCFGGDYVASLFGGSCDTVGACADGCGCGDNDCFQACTDAELDSGSPCDECLTRLTACEAASCSALCTSDSSQDSGEPHPDAGKQP